MAAALSEIIIDCNNPRRIAEFGDRPSAGRFRSIMACSGCPGLDRLAATDPESARFKADR